MGNIQFIDDTHTYLDEQGKKLISVSSFVERFKNKQDWSKIATAAAKKATKNGNPTTAQELLDKWNFKRDESARIGTIWHEDREQEVIKDGTYLFNNNKLSVQGSTYKGGIKYSFPIHDLDPNTLYPELIIFDEDLGISGQSDKVIITDSSINILDWKTDQSIDFKGYSSEWSSAKKMLPPISHLDECNGNIYSLKMSLYMYLLWKAHRGRYKPGNIIIEHVNLKRDPDNDNIPVLVDGKPVVLSINTINLPYRKQEVISMLNTLK